MENTLIEAAVEFLNRNTTSKQLNENVKGTYINKLGPKINVNHKYEASQMRERMKHHESDSKNTSYFDESERSEHKKFHELASKAHQAHLHAQRVNNNNKFTPEEKSEATRKAVHSTTRYWRSEPMTSHEHGSEHNENKFDHTVYYHKHVMDDPRD